MIDVIIAAAGRGDRMGGAFKQFANLSGKPLIYYSIEQFVNYGVKKIIVVVPEEKLKYTKRILNKINYNIIIITGGIRRQDSVLKGIKECDSDIILIHDAVRPFIKRELIDKVVKGVNAHGVCAPGIPIDDTIKMYSKDRILWTKARRNILQIQTPQGFKFDILNNISILLGQDNVTDELSIAEKLNFDVFWVFGDRMNIKITYPGDMELAQIIAKSWSKQ
jgi:2-C-methyl-D-erythritol 4-phosphate cytidylyltransferase